MSPPIRLLQLRVHLDMPFFRELFYGLRLLRRNPGFYLLAVLVISLGIGHVVLRNLRQFHEH